MAKLLFPASVVGSMPRPDFVRDLIGGGNPISDAEYQTRMDAAVRYIVALQEQAGLDVVTDGEWRRKSYIGVIADMAHGFELSTNPSDGRPWTIVVDRLAPKEPGVIAEEVRFLKSITNRKVKATLPSPALLGERMWDARQSSRAYPDRNDFVKACVPILRQEMACLQAMDVDIVQIDDPHLCLFVDPVIRAQYADADKAADFAVAMVNDLVSGFNDVHLAVHLCRRAGARVRGEQKHGGGYGPIINQLNNLQVDHLTMEFTAPGANDLAVFDDLREDFEIGLGCVGVHPGEIDQPETIVKRVSLACERIDPERITLNPDCGFAPGSGAIVSIDETYQKLVNEVKAAEMLRAQFA
ncbi:MAG: cobalamin-independent methionine synthase II family protein [Verrucomicrobia bacterium]|nr:cobalamin-independent methionine synthase II family protein [Verrucomicrobiota bacterium]